jgi:RND superfamily putative drug exporter
MLAFRSVLVPLVGAALNLVSVAAAFGVVVAVFQWGWLGDLIGLGKAGPIEPFLPVVLFAMLFGLSMDYQVFLVSRMREEWHRTGDNATAVSTGHADTGKVIVAAASIMVFVFGAFVFGDSRTIKLLGLGMAAAVLLDAFIIRMLVVPALMHRIGPANWWLPRWLDRALPHVSVEGSVDDHPQPQAGEPVLVGSEHDANDS